MQATKEIEILVIDDVIRKNQIVFTDKIFLRLKLVIGKN